MSDPSILARLESLQLILGKPVRLEDPPPDIRPEERQLQDPAPASTMQEDHDSWIGDPIPFQSRPESSPKPSRKELAKARKAALAKKHLQAFDCTDFHPGEPLGEDAEFCAWKVVTTYPSCFIGKTNRPRAKPFFDDILLERTWDFFYLYDHKYPKDDPCMLVPTAQFEAFLDDINMVLDTALKIPDGAIESKFLMRFGEGGTPRPRYLRRSINEKGLNIPAFPPIHPEDAKSYEEASKNHKELFFSKIRLLKNGINEQVKNNSEKVARKAKERRKMLLNAQKYLGLNDRPADSDVVFISVDVEALEMAPNLISEIGFAILDMRNTFSILPGADGANWAPLIKAHHLRVYEYAGLRNYRFVQGCPDRFDFGKSTFPKKRDVRKAIDAIVEPFTKDNRKIVFVGHDIFQDIKYLASIDYQLLLIGNVVGEVDSKDIHQAWTGEVNGRGLTRVLDDLGIAHKNLHNAGNDAVYTLQAVIGVTFRSKSQGGRGHVAAQQHS